MYAARLQVFMPTCDTYCSFFAIPSQPGHRVCRAVAGLEGPQLGTCQSSKSLGEEHAPLMWGHFPEGNHLTLHVTVLHCLQSHVATVCTCHACCSLQCTICNCCLLHWGWLCMLMYHLCVCSSACCRTTWCLRAWHG